MDGIDSYSNIELDDNTIEIGGTPYSVSDKKNMIILKEFDDIKSLSLNITSEYNKVDNETEDFYKKCDAMLHGVYLQGFEKPTAIQSLVIPQALSGRDILMQSRSGSGKTAAFTIAALFKVDLNKKYPHILILSNTHELALQTKNVIEKIGNKFNGLKISLCIGGLTKDIPIHEKKKYIKNEEEMIKNSHIVVGTLGRTYDMIDKEIIMSHGITFVVIDEADKFMEDERYDKRTSISIKNLITSLPSSNKCQILLSSATYNDDDMDIIEKFMYQPVKIMMKDKEINVKSIKQYYVDVEEDKYKADTLHDIYQSINISQAIIFVKSCERAEALKKYMESHNHAISLIHGKMTENQRQEITNKFKNGFTRVLITTDLYSRGIDVQQVNIVINYDFPPNGETYIHRVGRTGRFGRNGLAISFVTNNDQSALKRIKDTYGIDIQNLPQNFHTL
jgi:ATP-dependent RNA helicase